MTDDQKAQQMADAFKPLANLRIKPLLDFDDAGADDDHPAQGVTVGDIRAWRDERACLLRVIEEYKTIADNLAASHEPGRNEVLDALNVALEALDYHSINYEPIGRGGKSARQIVRAALALAEHGPD